jgi:CubicO group peptidase (beta-lactamase class C family)
MLSPLSALLIGAALAAAPPSLASPDSARSDSTSPPPRTVVELESRIRDVLERTHTPGIGLALVTRDSVLYTGGIGKADVASGRAATGKTLFRIGSTSKAVTSLAVLMLQEEGKLRLEDPLRTHIPEIAFVNRWESTDPVRIVNALEHSTGFDDFAFRDYANSDPTPLTLRQGLDYTPSTRVSRWRPGTRVSYSNTGPPLAAYVVEKLEGKPFEQVVQERIFDPLGMRTATYLFPSTTPDSLATLYQGDGRTPNPYWHVIMRPAGSINASAEDMAQYVRFLLNRGAVNGRQLLPPSAIDRLERTEASLEAKAGLPVGYGLHMARYVDSGYVWTGHDGGVNGAVTNLAYIPEAGVGFSFTINSSNGKALKEISALVRGFLTREIPRPTPPQPGAMPSVARSYAGWYRPDNPRVQHIYFAERLLGLARASVDDTSLVLRPLLGKPSTYYPVSGVTFRGEREPVATLALVDDSADGRPIAIEQMGYLLPTSLVHVSAPVAWAEVVLTAGWVIATILTLIVAVIVGVRFVVRRIRRRTPAAVSPARPVWRVAIGTTIALAVGMGLAVAIFTANNPFALGEFTPLTAALYLSLWLFALLALVGLVVAIRHAEATTRFSRVSLWTARCVAALNLVAAVYLVYWGFIGWRTWS